MTEITKTEHRITVVRYTWICPDCSCARDERYKPGPDDVLCYPCVLKREEQEWQKRHDVLIGSTVVSLVWTVGMGFRGLVMRDADGNEWTIRGPMTCEQVMK